MALLHLEGFEVAYSVGTYLYRKMISGSDANQWVDGRFGGKALRTEYNKSFGFAVDNKQTIIIGFALNYETLEYQRAILKFLDGATEQIALTFGIGGTLQLYRGSTLLAETIVGYIKRRCWHYIELKVTIHNTAGSVECKVDGDNVFDASGIDTQVSANSYVNKLIFYPSRYEIDSLIDDIYICDTIGTYNIDFLGDKRIVTVKPEVDGSSTDFTIFPNTGEDHYEDVDDGPYFDDDTTYIQSVTSGYEDLFTYEDLVDVGEIIGIQIFSDVKESDATNYTLITSCRTYTTDHDDTPQDLTSGYLIYSRVMDTEPEYAVPWTITTFNQSMFGVKVG